MSEPPVHFVFPSDSLDGRHPDDAFGAEVAACEQIGLPRDLVDLEALTQGEAARAVRRMKPIDPAVEAVYRGWMVSADAYRALYEALLAKGLRLVNDPEQYRHCHHLPESYPILTDVMPRTVWFPVPLPPIDAMLEGLRAFDDRPLVLKDYVKSQKHYWREACFISRASDPEAVRRVVTRFLELQAEDLVGGLVFREFADLESLGVHPVSGMPLALEYRLFFVDGACAACCPYWEGASYAAAALPDVDAFSRVAARVRSRFFSMDVGRRTDGTWLVIEVGDGQVSGIPEGTAAAGFYAALARILGAP